MANLTIFDDGSMTYTADALVMKLNSSFRLAGDFTFECAIDGSNTKIPQRIGIFPIGLDLQGSNYAFTIASFGFSRTEGNTNSNLFALCAPDNVAAGSTSVTFSGAANDRLSLTRIGNVVSLYKNYVSLMSEPILTGIATHEAYHLIIFQDNSGAENVNTAINKCRTTMGGSSYLYSVANQTIDFGSAQSSIKTRVYQESALVGKGDYVEANL